MSIVDDVIVPSFGVFHITSQVRTPASLHTEHVIYDTQHTIY